MTPAARLSGAIEVLADVEARRRPAPDALKDWGLAHRFAGSGDRAAIASLVYDALRRRASASWLMGEASPRSVLLGTLRLARGKSADDIATLASGERFAPAPLTEAERSALSGDGLVDAPAHVRADIPDWIAPSVARTFGDDMVAEAAALATRAPLDLRVNTLRSDRDAVAAELAHLSAVPTPWSPSGLRLPVGEDGRGPSVQSDPAFIRGEFEIQDEGSQLAALLSGAKPGETVIDLCAGGGGKTLALAAMMRGEGRVFATDADPRRLAPIHARLERAGAALVEIRTPRKADPVADLDGKADLVLVDAPCTGSGTWRRNPDAKWRLRPGSLSGRIKDQAIVLDRAARLVRPGGRICYVTCSVLPEENDEAVAALLARCPGISVENPESYAAAAGLPALAGAVRVMRYGIQMSPLRTGTDGFYVAMLRG
ncbi:RsmB/NOP family class I SAM-dependent RNA methyltransferase [uncultured Enterovirga sp.]|uniref:RsmB/NOP family class I SAM-dependent RNA methyltransferase n=1 Tax=uncultured Enterovirga sp. TaxID=2026352 RepID=UPI0035CA822E